MLLAGDIGGTKTILAVFASDSDPAQPLVERTFSSADYPSLEVMALEFLSSIDLKPTHGSFGVAGPVVRGKATTTNLPWTIDRSSLLHSVGLQAAHLLNDLEAIAHAAPHLGPDDLHSLNEGRPEREGALAIIAPGTGLGEAFLVWSDTGYRAYPSEGGHCDFSPVNDLELELLKYLKGKHGHVSFELVCSGIGIPNIYSFLKDRGHAEEPPWLSEELSVSKDPNPVIISNGIERAEECAICRLTLETFVSILGREAGNLALKVMATGGVYLGGGIPPKILPALEGGMFMEGFRNKGRMTSTLDRIPVRVIMNSRAALIGAACYGLERMEKD